MKNFFKKNYKRKELTHLIKKDQNTSNEETQRKIIMTPKETENEETEDLIFKFDEELLEGNLIREMQFQKYKVSPPDISVKETDLEFPKFFKVMLKKTLSQKKKW